MRDEAVGGDGERPAGLLDAAQVRPRSAARPATSDSATACGASDGERRGDRGDAGDHRHRDGQHVVDQQRAGRDQAAAHAEVAPG